MLNFLDKQIYKTTNQQFEEIVLDPQNVNVTLCQQELVTRKHLNYKLQKRKTKCKRKSRKNPSAKGQKNITRKICHSRANPSFYVVNVARFFILEFDKRMRPESQMHHLKLRLRRNLSNATFCMAYAAHQRECVTIIIKCDSVLQMCCCVCQMHHDTVFAMLQAASVLFHTCTCKN